MRCAHCKSRDVDIAHVRACSGMVIADDRTGPTWPPSEAQIKYVMGLQGERSLPDEYTVRDETWLKSQEKDVVSRLIKELLTLPYKSPTGRGRVEYKMPAGRYAIMHEDLDEWWFFQVDKPTNGRWAGYTFIKRLIGAPGDYRKIDLRSSERVGWLAAIDKDPNKAMTDYGLRSGVCGRCSSPLTDPQSLARGIGPICLGKLGW